MGNLGFKLNTRKRLGLNTTDCLIQRKFRQQCRNVPRNTEQNAPAFLRIGKSADSVGTIHTEQIKKSASLSLLMFK